MTALKRTTYQTFRKVAFEMGLEEKVDYTARKGDVVEWESTTARRSTSWSWTKAKIPELVRQGVGRWRWATRPTLNQLADECIQYLTTNQVGY